jgi:hypothetical protein
MAKDQIEIALGESAAFQKLTQGLRHAIEGATEISTLRSDPNWMIVALQYEKLLKVSNEMFSNATRRAVQGRRLI